MKIQIRHSEEVVLGDKRILRVTYDTDRIEGRTVDLPMRFAEDEDSACWIEDETKMNKAQRAVWEQLCDDAVCIAEDNAERAYDL